MFWGYSNPHCDESEETSFGGSRSRQGTLLREFDRCERFVLDISRMSFLRSRLLPDFHSQNCEGALPAQGSSRVGLHAGFPRLKFVLQHQRSGSPLYCRSQLNKEKNDEKIPGDPDTGSTGVNFEFARRQCVDWNLEVQRCEIEIFSGAALQEPDGESGTSW